MTKLDIKFAVHQDSPNNSMLQTSP